ncbi:3-hydroxy-3-methylglutaryl CoA synthase [Halorarum halobium]|uniref:3-hydroxy-3-methylglutaryl CoA synthase n=1 Tax=Halorarum halobium TaxID=3075121 RepID=UPI0028AD716E|nr:3-hydroxy-3-methylglutaryl CoA synthase [Halobaculum sp. XH14]
MNPDADAERGILAAGVYVPRARLPAETVADAWGSFEGRGIDTTAVPAGDEDAVTMGVAAAERAFEANTATGTSPDSPDSASVAPDEVGTLAFATTTPPLEEEQLGPRLVRALGLPDSCRTWEHGGSTAAGADAIQTALDADGPALAVVADAPEGDPAGEGHAFGAGAAAFLVADDALVPCEAVAAATDESPGIRFRERGATDLDSLDVTGYERAATRETTRRAIADLDVDPDEIRAAAVHQPNGSMPSRIADGDVVPADAVSAGLVADRVGDAGAATVPMGLVEALSTPGDGPVLAAFFGSGGSAVAFSFAGELDAVAGTDFDDGVAVEYAESLRKRGRLGDGEVAGGGANVSLPNWRRTLDARYALTAGRCPECGTLSFPGEGACGGCHERVEYERVSLSREGTVEARTVIGQGGAPPEFVALQRREGDYAAVLVRLPASEADGSVVLPAQVTDCDPDAVEVGDSVRRTVRRIYDQEGVPRYGAKFKPTG